MEGGVQVLSREIVKPSSKNHPKNLKLSYLDHTIPSVHIPIIFFYQANESKGLTASKHIHISKELKKSLSDTLTSIYPLAGRMHSDDNIMVDCNDAGIKFIGARVDAQLVDVLNGSDLEDYDKLKQYYCHPMGPFLSVQITFFDCGGIALGICFSHLFADLHSIMMFIMGWASACRSDKIVQTISFDLANYFPAREVLSMGIGELPTEASDKKSMRTKMLLFDKEKIQVLKQNSISTAVKDPTTVEAISAFIWKFMLDQHTTKTKTTVAAVHSVNLRERNKHLENIFGNCMMITTAYADDGVVEFPALVAKLRRSIRKIDDEYIRESQNGDTYMNDAYKMISSMGEARLCKFSSWCRVPFYQVDYGFGAPILFCPAAAAEIETFYLVSSKSGENTELWVTMEQHILEMLKNQIDLISSTIV